MPQRTTFLHDGEILIHGDTIEAPGKWFVDVWQASDQSPIVLVVTVRHGYQHESPVTHGPTIGGYAVVARVADTPVERFEEARRQGRMRHRS